MKKYISANYTMSDVRKDAAIKTIKEYLDEYGHYSEVLDVWETTDSGIYVLLDDSGDTYVLRCYQGGIYNVNGENVWKSAKNSLE